MVASAEIKQRYEDALASFVRKVKEDRLILAAILCGSLSYDEVWEKSDIDLLLVGREEVKTARDYCLTENGVNIHALLYPRSKFKNLLEGAMQGSFFHSYFSKSTLLYTVDESIREYYEDHQKVGARDRQTQLMRWGAGVLPALAKAEKWHHVRRDYAYSALYVLFAVDSLAHIETIMAGQIPTREVLQQALRLNPEFFRAVYLDFIDQPKNEQTVGEALARINGYLDEKVDLLFGPILEYMTEEGGVRSTTELDTYFKKVAHGGLMSAYEWLADKGVLHKVGVPLRLTEKSRATVDEAAYYYEGNE